ncbi:MFS transporter, DHA3 family, macrolide efflux protein [Propionibacterium cyclohexanicum]|uniref:MFS transporter, DHA3 family, macrolide efflux protein n=1 Tax=Propionibacterium cyclohexanicum TaxID=64702 RepID=A0A1H9SLE9_9ACTN|nr:MFS transporter, DHA3 family, macrolide efflux protein [Propionibacterium cyclohexanicum]
MSVAVARLGRVENPPLENPTPSQAPQPAAAVPGTDPVWKRRIALFLTGQSVSLFGSMLVQYAVMWYLTLETKSGTVMMAYSVFAFVPQALVSLFGGTLADRVNRKVLIICSDATIALTTLVLALVMNAGHTDLWLIYAAVAVRSVGAGFQTPAVSAVIPQLVPQAHLLRINGINTTIQSAMALLAPAAAGAVFAAGGIVPTFFVDVVTAAIGIAILAFIPVPTLRSPTAGASSYLADLTQGVRYAFGNRVVRWVMTVYAIIFVLTGAPSFLTPLMVTRSFGDEVWMLTVLEITFSAGMMLAGGAISAWFTRRSREHMILVACICFGLLSIALGLSTNLWPFYVFMFCTGAAVPFFSTPAMTLLQEKIAPEYMGRVFSFISIVFALGMPVGMLVFGPLADRFSVESLLVVAGIITLGVVAVAFSIPDGRSALADGRAYRALKRTEATHATDEDRDGSSPDGM